MEEKQKKGINRRLGQREQDTRRLPRFDGKDTHALIDCEGKLKAILSMSAMDAYNT